MHIHIHMQTIRHKWECGADVDVFRCCTRRSAAMDMGPNYDRRMLANPSQVSLVGSHSP